MVVLVGVVAVVGGQQRRPQLLGQTNQVRIGPPLGTDAVVLNLDEEVVTPKDVLHPAGDGQGVVETLLLGERVLPALVGVHDRGGHQGLQHLTAQTAAGDDHTLAVGLKQLPVHPGLLVVALEIRPTGQLDEVAVALVGFRQGSEVVVLLSPPFGLAAGVILAATAGKPLGAVFKGLVKLDADDWLHASLACRLVHLQHAIHVSVIGDSHRWLAVGRRSLHHITHPRCTVEHGVLGMQMQVDE